jgi:hypothetical protein
MRWRIRRIVNGCAAHQVVARLLYPQKFETEYGKLLRI